MASEPEDPRLVDLAKSIADGDPVDWESLGELNDPAVKAVLDELRRVEQVAQLTTATPTTWGRFRIVGELGRGTFGTVYRAIDPNLQREVALKVVSIRGKGTPAAEAVALWEARSPANITHPNIVRIITAERIGNELGISMELVRGRTLAAIVTTDGPFSANEAALIGRDVCRALAAVHHAGKLHGDVKAHNVMREDGGRIVLMDFGTGRDMTPGATPHGSDIAGTAAYLAPEVFAGAPRSASSDLYSLGVLLYYLASGLYPVPGATRSQIERQHAQAVPPRPLRDARPDLPDAFVRVVDRALSQRPEDRYPSAGAMEAALIAISDSARKNAPSPVWRFVLAVSLAAVSALAVLLYRQGVRQASAPATATASTTATLPSPLPNTYQVAAALYEERDGGDVRLDAGARIAPGRKLSLQFQASVPTHVYVINEDDHGESYLLFPLPGQSQQNPVPAGQPTRLPGMQDGQRVSWQVTSPGEREHFIVIAAPNPSPVFERLVAEIPAPRPGAAILSHRLTPESLGTLRGVGGLTASPLPVDRQLRDDPNFSTPLPSGEETVSGLWIRRLTLENPSR